MAFLRESKLEVMSREIVLRLWLKVSVDFVFSGSIGVSGGILVILCVSGGRWLPEGWECGIVSMYAPLCPDKQAALWLDLVEVLVSEIRPICVSGDLNMARWPFVRSRCPSLSWFSYFGSGNYGSRIFLFLVTISLVDLFLNVRKCCLPYG
ncbi:hypothetical protein GQ457_13G018060 [Hibiscus cannabinus]